MKDRAEEKTMVFSGLHRGSQYRLKCMMEHELHHLTLGSHASHASHAMRRLSEAEGSEMEFATQSTPGASGLWD